MCGIAGWYCFGEARPNPAQAANVFLGQEIRGRAASGAAFINHNRSTGHDQICYIKADTPVETFLSQSVGEERWAQIARSPIALLHARQDTKGSPKNNANNHPVEAFGWLVTHNGVIQNDDDLFTHLKVDRPAEVDTSAINLVLGQGQSTEESLGYVSTLVGTASVAAWNVARPRELVLFRAAGSPFHLFWCEKERILYWGSDPWGFHVLPSVSLGPITFGTTRLMEDNTALILSPNKIKYLGLQYSPFFPKPHALPPATTNTSSGIGYSNVRYLPAAYQGGGGKTSSAREALEDYTKLGKPAPLLDRAQTVLGTLPTVGETPLTVETGYGRWVLEKGVVRKFKPHKRIREFWSELKPLLDQAEIQLPADAALQPLMEGLGSLERVALHDDGWVCRHVYMCPWCGIMGVPFDWTTWQLTCPWCLVESEPPPKLSLVDP